MNNWTSRSEGDPLWFLVSLLGGKRQLNFHLSFLDSRSAWVVDNSILVKSGSWLALSSKSSFSKEEPLSGQSIVVEVSPGVHKGLCVINITLSFNLERSIKSKLDLKLTISRFNFNVGLSWNIDRTLDVDSSSQELLSEWGPGSNISSVGS